MDLKQFQQFLDLDCREPEQTLAATGKVFWLIKHAIHTESPMWKTHPITGELNPITVLAKSLGGGRYPDEEDGIPYPNTWLVPCTEEEAELWNELNSPDEPQPVQNITEKPAPKKDLEPMPPVPKQKGGGMFVPPLINKATQPLIPKAKVSQPSAQTLPASLPSKLPPTPPPKHKPSIERMLRSKFYGGNPEKRKHANELEVLKLLDEIGYATIHEIALVWNLQGKSMIAAMSSARRTVKGMLVGRLINDRPTVTGERIYALAAMGLRLLAEKTDVTPAPLGLKLFQDAVKTRHRQMCNLIYLHGPRSTSLAAG
jgi:hypothetical protein